MNTKIFIPISLIFSLAFFNGLTKVKAAPTQVNLEAIDNQPVASASPTLSTVEEATPVQIDWEKEIETTKKSLIGQLEEYRTAYRAFLVAKQQLSSLETLKSIEDATQALKLVMEKRILVVQSHYQLLQIYLLQNAGIEPKVKDNLAQRLDNTLIKIEKHKNQLSAVQNRAQAQVIADNYLTFSEELESISYTASAWFSFGKIQAVYWQAMGVYQILEKTTVENLSKTETAERQRALEEIANLLTKVQADLDKHNLYLTELLSEETVTKQQYSKFTTDLSPTYASLNKILSYYQELNELYGK